MRAAGSSPSARKVNRESGFVFAAGVANVSGEEPMSVQESHRWRSGEPPPPIRAHS